MIIHVVDGTYELFRHFYGLRRFTEGKDRPFGGVIGVLQTVLQMLEQGATHVGVATAHVIESFRNDLWEGYKTGEGLEPALFAQFHPLERRSPRWASSSGRWSSSRPTTRSPPLRGLRPRTGAWRKSASGRSTRILLSASAATGWCRWTAARTRSAMLKACARSSVSSPS
jgi:hypothetical protein